MEYHTANLHLCSEYVDACIRRSPLATLRPNLGVGDQLRQRIRSNTQLLICGNQAKGRAERSVKTDHHSIFASVRKDESRSGQSNDSLFLLSAEVNQATTLPPIGDATAAAAQCRSFPPAVFLHSIFFARAKRKLREKPSSPPSVSPSLLLLHPTSDSGERAEEQLRGAVEILRREEIRTAALKMESRTARSV